jgi:eukaryotic-like serine/threonine-protein kinase
VVGRCVGWDAFARADECPAASRTDWLSADFDSPMTGDSCTEGTAAVRAVAQGGDGCIDCADWSAPSGVFGSSSMITIAMASAIVVASNNLNHLSGLGLGLNGSRSDSSSERKPPDELTIALRSELGTASWGSNPGRVRHGSLDGSVGPICLALALASRMGDTAIAGVNEGWYSNVCVGPFEKFCAASDNLWQRSEGSASTCSEATLRDESSSVFIDSRRREHSSRRFQVSTDRASRHRASAARKTGTIAGIRRVGLRARTGARSCANSRHPGVVCDCSSVLGYCWRRLMTAEAPFRQGDIVAQKFRIVRVLGSGGMGMVFEADHLDLDRRVALKVMVRNVDNNEDAVARFLREARAAARLNSPHVAKVLDVGRLEQGAPYLVMELLEGQNLQALIKKRGRIPVTEAVDYLLEACEALAEAHGAGIVHRDIKPANLFLANDAYGGQVIKLLDFGVSKIHYGDTQADPQLTDTHSMMGSPAYMSPEQMRSARNVDQRSDIWSLGAVLFEMVTGRIPWTGFTLGDVLMQVASEPTPSIRNLTPTAPPALDALVSRCLEKNPAGRYQSVADLALALFPLGSDRARATFERVLRISGQDIDQAVATNIGSRPAIADPEPAPNPPAPLAVPSKQKTLLYGSSQVPALEVSGAVLPSITPERESPSDSLQAVAAPRRRRFAAGTLIAVLLGALLLTGALLLVKHRAKGTEPASSNSFGSQAGKMSSLGAVPTSAPVQAAQSVVAAQQAKVAQPADSVQNDLPGAKTESMRDTTVPHVQHLKGNAHALPEKTKAEQLALERQNNPQPMPKPSHASDNTAQLPDPMSVRR